MKRSLPLVAAVAATLLGAVVMAPSATAITNPAANPHKITVQGDDGKTYVDGQDTLPGYDDEECTYIPGAWFDFANDRVHYADGRSIPWTEWDRATGYEAWLKKQSGQKGGGSGPKPGTTSKPSNSGGGSSSTSGSKAKGGSASEDAPRGAAAEPAKNDGPTQTTASTAPAAETGPTSAPEESPTAGATGPTDPGAPTGAALAGEVGGGDTALSASGGGSESSAGVLVLVALALLGGLAVAGRGLVTRFTRRESVS